jgi:methylmalonyl-CoA/ethylmalonyl-CoA epimerase
MPAKVGSVLVDVRGIHHLGVAVADLEAAVATYERLFGARVEHRELLAEQGVEVVSLRIGEDRVELLAPLAADTPVGRFLLRRGPGMHHIAFEVGDLELELERLHTGGAELIDELPRRGAFGLEVAFIHPEATGGVLAELVAHG